MSDDDWDYYDDPEFEYALEPGSNIEVECDLGTPFMPQLGTEWCEFLCPFAEECAEYYYSRPNCPRVGGDVDCEYFHFGKCYADISRVRRLFCRWWTKG